MELLVEKLESERELHEQYVAEDARQRQPCQCTACSPRAQTATRTTHDLVIPAKAGIQERRLETTVSGFPLSRE